MTITGIGKWFKLENGIMKFGKDATQYGTAESYDYTHNNVITQGITSSLTYIGISNLNDFSIEYKKGYTGIIPMYTYFYDPYNVLIWDQYDLNDFNPDNVLTTYKQYRFVNGFMVGEVT